MPVVPPLKKAQTSLSKKWLRRFFAKLQTFSLR